MASGISSTTGSGSCSPPQASGATENAKTMLDSEEPFIDARERCVRSRIALFVRCLPPSLPRRKACLDRAFVQTAERDLSTLANGVFVRASRSLSAVFLPRSQDEKRVLVVRSSRQRSAIY